MIDRERLFALTCCAPFVLVGVICIVRDFVTVPRESVGEFGFVMLQLGLFCALIAIVATLQPRPARSEDGAVSFDLTNLFRRRLRVYSVGGAALFVVSASIWLAYVLCDLPAEVGSKHLFVWGAFGFAWIQGLSDPWIRTRRIAWCRIRMLPDPLHDGGAVTIEVDLSVRRSDARLEFGLERLARQTVRRSGGWTTGYFPVESSLSDATLAANESASFVHHVERWDRGESGDRHEIACRMTFGRRTFTDDIRVEL